MASDTYPGKGLSLPQLVFALSKELSHATRLPLLAYDMVSQLERDISTALISVRELRNSIPPINRVPLDVLTLIPTYLTSQRDLFRTTFVCRHWRNAFLQHAALWSRLYTRKGEDYMKALLERTKGSALDVVIDHGAPLNTITLLLPHTRQIRHLIFSQNYWTEISTYSQVLSGPLPLLRTLTIQIDESGGLYVRPNTPDAPLPLLFSGAVNLETFVFEPESAGSLDPFVFPNLTTFKLSTPPLKYFKASDLLDFLDASPMLRTVEVRVRGGMYPEGVTQELVVLPNVETFSLNVNGGDWQVYKSAMRISCPRAKYTSLEQDIFDHVMTDSTEVFPNSNSCKAIVRQYSTSPVEEVTLEINDSDQSMTMMTYSLTFKSTDAAVIRMGFELGESGQIEEELYLHHGEMNLEIFTRACQTIQDLPQLASVRRLHIKDWTEYFGAKYAIHMVGVLQKLFGSLGPLDELSIHGHDLRVFLSEYPVREFPLVKELRILEVSMFGEERYVDGIVKLAKSQHELERPFERVTVRAWGIPVAMAERLGQWVSVVDCSRL